LNCVLLRAQAVVMLLSAEFMDEERDQLMDRIIVNALWDIEGHLRMAQKLVASRF